MAYKVKTHFFLKSFSKHPDVIYVLISISQKYIEKFLKVLYYILLTEVQVHTYTNLRYL